MIQTCLQKLPIICISKSSGNYPGNSYNIFVSWFQPPAGFFFGAFPNFPPFRFDFVRSIFIWGILLAFLPHVL